MEVGLFLVAAVVIFIMYRVFQDYMRNPIVDAKRSDAKHQQELARTEQQEAIKLSPKDKLMVSQYGLVARIVGKVYGVIVPNMCMQVIVDKIIDDLYTETGHSKEILGEIFNGAKEDDPKGLAEIFLANTKGEYKKRLKLLQILFSMAYVSGDIKGRAEDLIRDIARDMRIDSDDFNDIYYGFENIYNSDMEITRTKALIHLKLDGNFTKDSLDERLKTVILENTHNITDHRDLNKNFVPSQQIIRSALLSRDLLAKECE